MRFPEPAPNPEERRAARQRQSGLTALVCGAGVGAIIAGTMAYNSLPSEARGVLDRFAAGAQHTVTQVLDASNEMRMPYGVGLEADVRHYELRMADMVEDGTLTYAERVERDDMANYLRQNEPLQHALEPGIVDFYLE